MRNINKLVIVGSIITGMIPSLSFAREAYLNNWVVENTHLSHVIQGNKKVIVAVVDTGIDASVPGQVAGYDYVENRTQVIDIHSHGTHIAGIIRGVASNVSLMPVRYYSDKNSGAQNLSNSIKSIYFAINHGAKVINYSGGGPSFSAEEFKALKKAEEKGILVVAAAGNEHQNTDEKGNAFYPAAYRLSNIISVASIDMNSNILPSSNYGVRSVDVAAPGENIRSTLPQGRFGAMTGTSQATAFVSGIAALLLSKNPNLSPSAIRHIIMKTVDVMPQLKAKVTSSGRVNAARALLALN